MQSSRRGILLIVGILVISALVGGVYGPSMTATAAGSNELQDSIYGFTRVLSKVKENYADPVDVDRVIYQGAIPGMLRTLDPHSTFFDARQFTVVREEQRGKYYGVGMTVAPREGMTIVLAPFVGSPAYKAGIRPGDVILKVDDRSAQGLTTSDVADMLKGPKGTVVRITLGREGWDEPINVNVTRDEIPRHAVDAVMEVKPGIGYIRVTQFNETTDSEVAAALKQLNAGRLDGLILDLRGNPGGLLNEAVFLADMFLEKGQLIVRHRGRNSQDRPYFAPRGNGGIEMPLVVLINGQSASASEIVAGAIQDHDRGLIVGEGSFGKGLVQTVFQLSENSGMALTTAKYYTPSGRLIQRDYKSVSLYEYHNNRGKTQPHEEVRLTDSGRQVYGGGGIAPDTVVEAPKLEKFQQMLITRDVFFPFEAGVGGFVRFYLGQKPKVTREFAVDDAVMGEFRKYLDKQNVRYTEADIEASQAWIKRRIKREVFVSVFGLNDGFKVGIEDDPQVLKAIEVMPQARALYENAKKVTAQRMGGAASRQ